MSTVGPNLLIIGASTRSAAFSALRSGLKPLCLDAFADLDLRANARVQRIENYPHGLIAALHALPRLPLLYVGGMECYPDVLEVAAEYHELLGNGPDVVQACRHPETLATIVRLAQAHLPESLPAHAPPPQDGTWLIRPLSGSGGRGIAVWDAAASHSPTLAVPHQFQKRIEGVARSALYLAADEIGDVRFVGVTEQLVGEPLLNAAAFQWCGNLGPTTLSIPVEHKMRRIGNLLKSRTGLRGLFGVDYLVTPNDEVYLIDVNPRYPGSTELLEFATAAPLLGAHVRCFTQSDALPAESFTADWQPPALAPLLGKAILYAAAPMTCRLDLSGRIADYGDFPQVADLPAAGTTFATGDPICSLFAQGSSVEACRENLFTRVRELQTELFPVS